MTVENNVSPIYNFTSTGMNTKVAAEATRANPSLFALFGNKKDFHCAETVNDCAFKALAGRISDNYKAKVAIWNLQRAKS